MKTFFISIFCAFFLLLSSAFATPQPAPVDQAFRFSVSVDDPQTIIAHWRIAPGYFLYKDRFSYKIVSPKAATLGSFTLPNGIKKYDDILGQHQVYQGNLALPIPIKRPDNAPKDMTIKVCYQGCSANGYCYPPQTKEVMVSLDAAKDERFTGKTVNGKKVQFPISEQDKLTQLLANHNITLILLSFFGFGLLLSFTPCVLPMIPILSGLIIGHGESLSLGKAFRLSLTYVLAMAVTYAIAGIAAGFAGHTLQAALQTPWIIISFSLIFVLLALSLFGFYELRLPSKFEEKISSLSNKQKSGNYVGVGIMGVLSTLIVSPCVSAPLIGALAYIGQTGDAILGGSALFAMGLGMGVPLLIIGTSGGKLLPKAGSWMQVVEASFGVMLLAVAIWMLERILPGQITLALWAALFIISAVYMGILNPEKKHGWANFWKGLGLLFVIYGIILLIGATMGNSNPLEPLANGHAVAGEVAHNSNIEKPLFAHIKNNDDFDRELDLATSRDKIIMLDFYADWCISCKEMDRNTFSHPEVKTLLNRMVALRADVTNNDLQDQALEERLKVIAPPTILFFDKQGSELANYRIVGEQNAEQFLQHLQRVLGHKQ